MTTAQGPSLEVAQAYLSTEEAILKTFAASGNVTNQNNPFLFTTYGELCNKRSTCHESEINLLDDEISKYEQCIHWFPTKVSKFEKTPENSEWFDVVFGARGSGGVNWRSQYQHMSLSSSDLMKGFLKPEYSGNNYWINKRSRYIIYWINNNGEEWHQSVGKLDEKNEIMLLHPSVWNV